MLPSRHSGRLEEAAGAYRQAIALSPAFAEAHNNLGNALKNGGKLDEAVVAYRQAIVIKPNIADWHRNLGTALAALGKFDEAVICLRQAIAIRPDYAEAHADLATALKDLRRFDEAVICMRQAVAIKPTIADWHSNLGMALTSLGKFDEAVVACRQAIAIRLDYAEAYHNLAIALQNLRRFDEALVAYRQAVAIRPDYADAHGALGVLLLLLGNLREGFDEYRWRWQASNFPEKMPDLACPLWEGESLTGKTILVYCEQGYGDSLQFIRYIRPLSRMAVRVLVHTDHALASLFRSIPGIEVLTELPGRDDGLDYHIPLLCLPRLFGTALDTILHDVPYLSAEPPKVEHWSERLARYQDKIKIGLVWAGESRKHDPDANAIDRRRSMALQQLAPLAGIADVRFFSLQKGEPSIQARHPPAGMDLVDMTSDLQDFEDTAALVTNLDLVISVDTSVAHLAGALGKPSLAPQPLRYLLALATEPRRQPVVSAAAPISPTRSRRLEQCDLQGARRLGAFCHRRLRSAVIMFNDERLCRLRWSFLPRSSCLHVDDARVTAAVLVQCRRCFRLQGPPLCGIACPPNAGRSVCNSRGNAVRLRAAVPAA